MFLGHSFHIFDYNITKYCIGLKGEYVHLFILEKLFIFARRRKSNGYYTIIPKTDQLINKNIYDSWTLVFTVNKYVTM